MASARQNFHADSYEQVKAPRRTQNVAGLSPFDVNTRRAVYTDAVSFFLRLRPLICTGVFFSTSEPSFFFKTIS